MTGMHGGYKTRRRNEVAETLGEEHEMDDAKYEMDHAKSEQDFMRGCEHSAAARRLRQHK